MENVCVAVFLRNIHHVQIEIIIPLGKGTLQWVQQLDSLTEEPGFVFYLKDLKLATQLGNLLGHSSIFISETDLPEYLRNYLKPYHK